MAWLFSLTKILTVVFMRKRFLYLIPLAFLLLVGNFGIPSSKWARGLVFIYHRVVDISGDEKEERWDWVGTGFFVAPNVIMTAAHLHPDGSYDSPPPLPDELRFLFARPVGSSEFYRLIVLEKAKDERDIMTLRILGYKSTFWFKLGKAKIGEKVTILAGRAVKDDEPVLVKMSALICAKDFPEEWGITKPTVRPLLVISPSIWFGASGSPVLNKRGEVVGVVIGWNRTRQYLAEPTLP